MTGFTERRKYQRCSNLVCKVYVCTDGKRWGELELCDISAGGLKFYSSSKYDVDTLLEFDLLIYNMLSEFNMRLNGRIVRSEIEKDRYAYAVKFNFADKYNQVQLDEVIRSRVTLKNTKHPVHEDGIYAFLFMPRVKPASFHRKIRMYR